MSLLLRHEDLVGILTADEVRVAVLKGFLEQGEGQVQVPPRTTVDSSSGFGWLRLMPAILNKSKVMGFKAMHSTSGVGVRYFVMLYDLESGELLSQMDADWLTSQRTSATAAIGIDALADADIVQAGVLGSSEQARAMLAAASRVRKLRSVKVFSPTGKNRQQFAETMGRQLDLNITPVDSAEKAVSGSNLVLSAFRAGSEPVIASEWVDRGTHINAASSVRPEARELQDSVWAKCSVVAVDDKAHVFESGDGVSAIRSGYITLQDTVGIWEILDHSKPGRILKDDVTLFKAVGTGLQDLALALAIYKKAKDLGLGQDLGAFPRVRK